jgi:integrase
MATLKLGARTIDSLTPSTKPYEVRDNEIKGLLVRVQPSGSMSYYCEYRNSQGSKHRVRIGQAKVLSIAQARDEARKIIGEVARGLDPAAEVRKRRVSTVSAFLDAEYGPWALANLKRGEATLKCIKVQFKGFLTCRLDEITAWRIEKWIAERKQSGNKGATINRNVGMLKAALSKAVEWRILESHPLKGIKPQRVDSRGKVRFLSGDEESRLLEALDAREARIVRERESGNVWRLARKHEAFPDLKDLPFADYLKPLVMLSLNTGLRRGEAFSLKWADVDLIRNQITVQGHTAKSGQEYIESFRKKGSESWTVRIDVKKERTA